MKKKKESWFRKLSPQRRNRIVILTSILIILFIWYSVSIIIDFTSDDMPNFPSEAVKELIKNEEIYFTSGGDIYQSTGAQLFAKKIKSKNLDPSYPNSGFTYSTVILSPNGKYLAYHKVYTNSPNGIFRGNNLLTQIYLMNTETQEEKLVFDSKNYGANNVAWTMETSRFYARDDSEVQYFAMGWVNSTLLEFNFVDKYYVYDVNTGIFKEISDGLGSIDIKYMDTCYGLPYSDNFCFSRQSRFNFYGDYFHEYSGKYSYIKGIDTETNEEFLLTIFGWTLFPLTIE